MSGYLLVWRCDVSCAPGSCTCDDILALRRRLDLTETALRFERQHNAFLFRTFVLSAKRPVGQVQEASLWRRLSDGLASLLAGPGRG